MGMAMGMGAGPTAGHLTVQQQQEPKQEPIMETPSKGLLADLENVRLRSPSAPTSPKGAETAVNPGKTGGKRRK